MELNNDFRVSVPKPEAWKVLTDVERIAPLLPGAQLQEIEGDEFRGVVKVKVGPITAQYKGTATFLERDEASGHMVLKATGRDTRGQGNASAAITVTMLPDGDGTKVNVSTDLTITGKVAQFGRGVLADVSGKLIQQFVDALEADLESGSSSEPVDTAVVAAVGTAASGQEAGSDGPSQVATKAPAKARPASKAAKAAAGNGAVAHDAGAASEAGSAGEGDAPTEAEASAEETPADEAPAEEAAAEGTPVTPAPSSGPRRIDSPEPEPVDLLDAAGASVAKRLLPVAGVAAAVLILLALRRRSRRNRSRHLAVAIPDFHIGVPDLHVGIPDLNLGLPDLAGAQEFGRRAIQRASTLHVGVPDELSPRKLGRRAAKRAAKLHVDVPDLSSARELGRRAAKRAARRAAKLHAATPDLGTAQRLGRRAAKQAKKASKAARRR